MADAHPPPPATNAPDDAAERLLEREPPEGYLDAWARSLATPIATDPGERVSMALFRLGDERFALDAAVVREVHLPRRVHRLPGRTNDVLRGVVVLRGEVHLCADLHALVGCERTAPAVADGDAMPAPSSHVRMLVIARGPDTWAFEADQVLDVRRIDVKTLAPPQVTVAKASVKFTDGVFERADGPVAHLDPDRLFQGLARSLS